MAFTPFTPDELPSMANFNEKLSELFNYMKISPETSALLGGAETVNEALAVIGKALSEGVKIQVGSYVGTGTYQSFANGCTISCDFMPVFFAVTGRSRGQDTTSYGNSTFCVVRDASYCSFVGGNHLPSNPSNGIRINNQTIKWGDDYVSWYNYSNADWQMNISGETYNYIIIGY